MIEWIFLKGKTNRKQGQQSDMRLEPHEPLMRSYSDSSLFFCSLASKTLDMRWRGLTFKQLKNHEESIRIQRSSDVKTSTSFLHWTLQMAPNDWLLPKPWTKNHSNLGEFWQTKLPMLRSPCEVHLPTKVGFILSSDLPCTKNIQKIVSVFANRTGRICVLVACFKAAGTERLHLTGIVNELHPNFWPMPFAKTLPLFSLFSCLQDFERPKVSACMRMWSAANRGWNAWSWETGLRCCGGLYCKEETQ